jgi:hypothetical protein
MSIGATMLGRRHVLPSVCSTFTELMVEGTFPTGTYLVTVHHPISTDDGDLAKALYGSFLPIPDQSLFPLPKEEEYEATKMPGAFVCVKGKIVLNKGRKRIRLRVTSKGDRPIQVGFLKKEKKTGADDGRLVHITILSKQTPSSNSIVSRRMAIVLISQRARRFVSSQEIQRQSRWLKLAGRRLSTAAII